MSHTPSPLSRRTLLTATGRLGASSLLAAPILAACGSDEDESGTGGVTPATFQLSWLPTAEFGGTWIALERGLFKQQGLDVKVLNGGPNTSPDTVVVSRKALVGMANADAIAQARKNEARLKVIGALFQKSSFCVVSRADNPIGSPREMIGKKIGVAAQNQTAWNILLKVNKIDPKSINVVPVQFDPSPVANKEVDGQVVYYINEPTQLETKGVKTHTFLFADFGYHILSDVYFATEQSIKEDADTLVKFLTAQRKGWQALFAEPALGAELAVGKYGKDQGLDLAQQKLESTKIKDLCITPDSPQPISLPPKAMQQTVDTLKVAGIDITVQDLFDTSIIEKLTA
jgi:ABC-type nitrate/sulfonate/bicarbonate transport system substrate-binding protein